MLFTCPFVFWLDWRIVYIFSCNSEVFEDILLTWFSIDYQHLSSVPLRESHKEDVLDQQSCVLHLSWDQNFYSSFPSRTSAHSIRVNTNENVPLLIEAVGFLFQKWNYLLVYSQQSVPIHSFVSLFVHNVQPLSARFVLKDQ